jgi:SAM-dependent methyltransferase
MDETWCTGIPGVKFMTTDYDEGQVAQQYKKAKEQPWRSRVEEYSLMKRIGDLRGQRVVDAACGEGHYTRKLRLAGAAQVLGFDASAKMIELARAEEARRPLGIEYRVHDARTALPQQDFDLAVSAWLLVYARDRAELACMCRGLASIQRPGGRTIAVMVNPSIYAFAPMPDYRKYGFSVKLADRCYEGAPIRWTIHLDDSGLEIENYYLAMAAYESAFREAGFRDFQVHAFELGPNPKGGDDSLYWADFFANPTGILIECVKA